MADLTNNFGAYMQLPTFRFWCQHVIPLVYDDSLSYYEVLCKAVKYINSIIADLKVTQDNLTELAEDSEGKFEELETLINSSLTGEYGGIRRKVLAMTGAVREALVDERATHLRVDNIYYSEGKVDYIKFRIHGREFNMRFNSTTPGSFGMINQVRGYNISLTALYGAYNSASVDAYTDWTIYINGNPSTVGDFYPGMLLNDLTVYKRQNETNYFITQITADSIYIYYKYDSANIPGGGAALVSNPHIGEVTVGSGVWTDIIRDAGLQLVKSAADRIVIITQDENFVANVWHKLQMQW